MAFVEGVYRVLGAVARINERLWRRRLNFVPANVLLMIFLGTLAVTSWNNAASVLRSRRMLEAPPLSALLSGERPLRNYVALQGRLMTDARLAFGEKDSAGNLEPTDYAWVPLLDDATGKAILVQFAANHSLPANGSDVTLQGMLRPVTSTVSRQLSPDRYVHSGMPIERRFMLVEGGRPGSLAFPVTTASVWTLLVLALVWATLTRNVIFLPDDGAPSAGAAMMFDRSSQEPLLVSGTLTHDGKTRRFFNNMPALIHRMDSGETALVSHIETSSTFMGMKTAQHSGLWILGIRPGSITEAQVGHVFWGRDKRRAIRFRYVCAMRGTSARAVIASAGEHAASLFQAC
jgi:hypothetical protein